MMLALVAAGAAPNPAPLEVDRDLQLAVMLNGRDIGLIASVQERRGRLFATAKELREMGLRVEDSEARPVGPDGARLVAIATIPGVSARLDERTQTIFLAAPNDRLSPFVLRPGGEAGPAGKTTPGGIGAVLNYSATGTEAAGHVIGEALLDGRIFSPWGVASSGLLTNTAAARGEPPVVRLDSAYTYSDPDSLRRYELGDFITGGLSWTRPLRLAGLRVSTDFGLRPDLVTFPVPSLAGQVSVPSAVDVLVNGVQVLSGSVPPGPFEIRQLPVVTGAGDVALVIRTASGQQVTQTRSLYTSNRLLAPGLDALSAEAGMVRLDYGLVSNEYRSAASSVSYRRGLADWLTIEGHAEGGTGLAMGGGGVAVALGNIGVLSLDAAASGASGTSGGLASAAFEHTSERFSFGASAQLSTRGFRDLAAVQGEAVPRTFLQASAGLPLGRLGSIGVVYTAIRRDAAVRAARAVPGYFGLPDISGTVFAPAERVSLLSVSYSASLPGGWAYVYATGFHDFAGSSGTGAVIGVSIPLGARTSVSASADVQEGPQFGASRAAISAGDVGYQVLASPDQPYRALALGSYKTSFGLFDAGVDHEGGATAWRGSATGGLAFADGGLFASTTIQDSFAVVDTGTPGIGVLLENRPVATTDSAGRALVPDLRSYEDNRLAIEPRDVPMDATLSAVTQIVRPPDRSGVVASFAVRGNDGALVRLADPAGRAIPVGGAARLAGGEAVFIVGYDGEAFIKGLAAHNHLIVTLRTGESCDAEFDYHPQAGTLPRIGPVICRPVSPG